ncbi:hypothetical protein LJB77_00400 [Ruminococcaceae bacterium OttesenSCG-928-N02]|nr:hypothetical protein [Ruminococcaceae bacterium OttesenSCG-928-N02]
MRFLPLATLAFTTVFIYSMARVIERAQGAARRCLEGLGITICLLVLAFFKYNGFFLPTALTALGISRIALPLGISFYTFAGVGYLVDVARGTSPAEKSFCNVALFLCFFGTITSGPICRAGNFLPQLHQARGFNGDACVQALRLALVGFFKHVALANVLGLYVNTVFSTLDAYSGLTLIFSAAMYALQLYFEFSGYSDIACASALFLGLEIPQNFKTPYFATNFSGFWQRWHISLSTWLQDYLFTPLVWSRWPNKLPKLGRFFEKPPILSSLFLVFFISGLWHGNTLPYVVWGLLQGLFRIGEELMHKTLGKAPKKQSAIKKIAKRITVFTLWAISLVFFRLGYEPGGSAGMAARSILRWGQGLSLPAFVGETFDVITAGFYAKTVMVYLYVLYLIAAFAIAFLIDRYQFTHNKDKPAAFALARVKPVARWAIYYTLIAFVLIGFVLQSGGFGIANMAYGGF